MNRNPLELRAYVDLQLKAEKYTEAFQALRLLWLQDPASASFIVSRSKQLTGHLPVRPCRVAIERSSTFEPLLPHIKAAAFLNGIDLEAYLGPFNAYHVDLVDGASPLYAFRPNVVFLAILTRDIAPELWNDAITSSSDYREIVSRVVNHIREMLVTFRSLSSADIVIHTFETPAAPRVGVLDLQQTQSQFEAIRKINEGVRGVIRELKSAYLLDYDSLTGRYGKRNWCDEVRWQTVRLPIRQNYFNALANEWLKFLVPLTGRIAKVAVVDLDNTIWGGVIGEDGLRGIKLGPEYPGASYLALQRALLQLSDRGILLAVCSKNNLDDVAEVFREHPEMLLKLEHFSATKISWRDKSESLREIAAELNVGLDSLALIDDNPVERQEVGRALPEVQIVELPQDAALYADAVRDFPGFERLSISSEDQMRARYYTAQQEVIQLKAGAENKAEFLQSLGQTALIDGIRDLTITRLAQLTLKTNQFNLTGRRYTEQQLAEVKGRPGFHGYSVRVIDRYVDNGIVGFALTRDVAEFCEIDVFLLSCRVIGRGVETALLSHLMKEARARGLRFLRGEFVPSKKNGPAKEFFPSHGFVLVEESADKSVWQFDLSVGDIPWPQWFRLPEPVESAP